MDRAVLKERSKVKADLAKASYDLTQDLEMVLLINKKAERSNAYRTERISRKLFIIGIKYTCSSWGSVLKL